MYACSTFHTFALFNERTKINLKCLLTSFSINFDHKLTAGERYVCVCLLRWPNGWIKRGRSAWQISFLCQFALGELSLPMRMREENIFSLTKSIFTAQQQQRGGKLQKCWQSKLQASVLIT